jgi:serine/threonine-protein kinase
VALAAAEYSPDQYPARNAITTPMPRPPLPPPPEQEPTRLAPATPHPGPPGNRPLPRRRPSAVVIAFVGAALLIGGLLVFFGTQLSRQTSSSPSTVTIAPDTQVTSAPNSSVPPTPPPTTPAPAPPPPTTPSARPSGDLGLSTPMSRPACDGTGIVVLGNATNPGSYPADVQRLLNEYPGASYLRTDQACPSLRQSLNGNPIYAVYRVAGGTEADICAAVRAAGGETYGKWLDRSGDPNSYIRQSCFS